MSVYPELSEEAQALLADIQSSGWTGLTISSSMLDLAELLEERGLVDLEQPAGHSTGAALAFPR